MRRILFPLLVIGLAGGLFTLGSGAFFSDVESDTGNTITAGTLDLEKTALFSASCTSASLVKPGDGPVNCSATVTNAGSLDGDLYLRVVLVETDPAQTEPESALAPLNDLGAALVIGTETLNGTGTETAAATTWAGSADWNGLAMACTKVADLAPTQTFAFTLPTSFDSNAGNQHQGDTATLTFYYELVQDGQAASAGCGGPA
jgi:predicted ribosomally synthesized peptide with SipW-like signal peptide